MANLFNEILYRPLFNALIAIYQYLPFHDLGVAIILLTILIRLILFPLFYKSSKDQAIIQRLTPQIKEIQKTHKHNKEKQARALMELYREHKINPLSGFFLILLQLPVLIALYQVFLKGFSEGALNAVYTFIPRPEILGHTLLGFIDLTHKNLGVVILAVLAQYYQAKLLLPKKNNSENGELSTAEAMNRQMVYIGPIMTLVVLYFFNLPSAVALYWLTTTIFSVIQQMIVNKRVARYFGENKVANPK